MIDGRSRPGSAEPPRHWPGQRRKAPAKGTGHGARATHHCLGPATRPGSSLRGAARQPVLPPRTAYAAATRPDGDPAPCNPSRPASPPSCRPGPSRRAPAGWVRPDGPRPDGARPDGAKADAAAAAAGAAVAAPARRTKPVVRGVRSRRLVRRFDIWSVFKVSVIFYICVYVVMLVAGTVLWNVAAAFGVITDAEKLVRSLFALNTVHPAPHRCVLVGVGYCRRRLLPRGPFNVLAAVLYNLISDVVGGVQVIVVSRPELRRERVKSFGWRRYGQGL